MLPDAAGYRLYIESLFDEFSTEIKVLFDRRDAASVLWPKRSTFEELLSILNAADLSGVWGDDETIGWVYQFFNSGDERKNMRNESQTPRNSRELAVRNQFFTPRYIVEFLVDNTLGRLWIEMQGERTELAELCEHLVRPAANSARTRLRKDPRDLRVLDPACGSGHFLLYSFDLLLAIYEEAWRTEEHAPIAKSTGRSLREDYPDLKELHRAAPRLIVEHNLYGVDIDPRCAQIAALALWLRAQRAWKDFDIAAVDRPRIQRTHIVVAEPMPGDARLVEEFATRLDPPLLRDLFKNMVGESHLAGELGSLLRVEDGIAAELERARGQFVKQRQSTSFLPGMEPVANQGSLDLSGIGDDQFFHEAEARIVEALRIFADTTTGTTSVRRRLFSGDAAQGIALIDLVRTKFDVVLMNPPFGETTERALDVISERWPNAKRNLYIAFVYRAFELLVPQGFVGAITDATFIHQTRYEEYRQDLLAEEGLGLSILVANGWGVLDAYVETACVVASRQSSDSIVTFDERSAEQRIDRLLLSIASLRSDQPEFTVRTISRSAFRNLPKSVLAFWLPSQILRQYETAPSLAPSLVDARCGMSSSDNPRFYKLQWEVNRNSIGANKTWRYLANGGPPCPLFRQQVYVVKWASHGQETKSRVEALYGSASRTIINEPYYFRPGLTFGKRTESFTAQFLPAGQVFSNEGQAIFPNDESDYYGILAYLNSSLVAYLLNSIAGQHKEAGYVGSIPAPPTTFVRSSLVTDRMRRAHEILIRCASGIPESQIFTWPLSVSPDTSASIHSVCSWIRTSSDELAQIFVENDSHLEHLIGFESKAAKPWNSRLWRLSDTLYESEESQLESLVAADFVAYLLGMAFGRWQVPSEDQVDATLRKPTLELSSIPAAEKVSTAGIDIDILVSDPGHNHDIVTALENALGGLGHGRVDQSELMTACRYIDSSASDIRSVVTQKLFESHIDRYSKSRRKAPIYWQIATASARYSVWIYYHALTKDTLFKVQNDYVVPKLAHEERRLASMRMEHTTTHTAAERKLIAAQESLVSELREFLDEIKRVAPLWNPDLDDGVLLNFSPLWRLVPQCKRWQKELRATWGSLCAGDYDWAHIAMHLWPERVIPKCAIDRSLAIAHGLADEFWEAGINRKWKPRPTPTRSVDVLIRERASVAVKASVLGLTESSATVGLKAKTRRSAS